MFDQSGLAAAGDQTELLDAGGARLFHRVWISGLSTTGSISLASRLGGRQETRAKTGDGQDGFTQFLGHDVSPVWRRPLTFTPSRRNRGAPPRPRSPVPLNAPYNHQLPRIVPNKISRAWLIRDASQSDPPVSGWRHASGGGARHGFRPRRRRSGQAPRTPPRGSSSACRLRRRRVALPTLRRRGLAAKSLVPPPPQQRSTSTRPVSEPAARAQQAGPRPAEAAISVDDAARRAPTPQAQKQGGEDRGAKQQPRHIRSSFRNPSARSQAQPASRARVGGKMEWVTW